MHFPVNGDECKGGRTTADKPSVERGEESVVAFSDEVANSRRGIESGLGITATNFANSYIMRSKSNGMPVRSKDVGQATNLHVHHGKQAHHETNSSVPTNSVVQSLCGSAGDGDKGTSAQPDNASGGRTVERDVEADKMEFEGGGKITTAF